MNRFIRQVQVIRLCSFMLATTLVVALAGCDGKDVQVYKLAKDSPASKPEGGPMAAVMGPGATTAQPQLTWTLPEGWQELPASEMRLATFKAKGPNGKEADVSVIRLPGMAGGDLNNVNRWRGQIGLPPVTEEELAKHAEKIEAAGEPAELYDQAGTNSGSGEKTRIIGTILHREQTAWFFKMTGPDDLVAAQKGSFVAFLRSLKFASVPVATPLPADHPPITGEMPAIPVGHPAIGGAMPAMQMPAEAAAKPQWVVPATWKEEPPTQMLLAKFSTTAHGGRADVTVSSFPGDVGGLPANVNRWRRQVGLPPVDESGLATTIKEISVLSEKGSLVDLEGADGRRLIGVALPHGDRTWFFKMLGDGKTVGGEKDDFVNFVQSVKFSNAP